MKPEIYFIIPARGGSKRLPRKNLQSLFGKPLIQYAIEACKNSNFYNGKNIFVSTEDEQISTTSKDLEVSVIERPGSLAEDHVWTQDVLEHAVTKIKDFDASRKDHVVVRVQANSPQVKGEKIDECIEKLLSHNLWEVFTVDENGIEDAAVHVLRAKCVAQRALSVYKGVVKTNYIDVHDKDDLSKIKSMMENNANQRR